MGFAKITIILSVILSFIIASNAMASDQRKLTYAGRILKADSSPVEGLTQFKIQITDTAGTCILWEENSSVNVSKGVFNLQIGTGTNVFDGGGAASLNKIFSQGAAINCKAGGSTTPAQYDDRNLAVSFNDGSGWQSLTSQIPIKAVPFALSTSGIGGAQIDLTGLADTYVLKYNAASNTWTPAANGAGAGVSSVTAGTGINLTGTASNPVVNLTTPVTVANGGTGVNSAAAANGQLLIGNGTGFSLANLTQGAGITITNSAGGITIAATGSGTVTSVTAAATAGNPITIAGTASAPTVDITAASSGVNGYLKGADWNTFNGKLSAVSNTASLANTKIWIGDGTGKAQEKTLSQDVTIDNLGVATIGKIQNRLIDSTSTVGGVLSWDVGTSTWKAKAFPNCTTAQAPYFNGVADAIQCQTIAAAWGSVSGKPTTLSGYGITDGIQNAGVGAGNVITTVQSGNTAGRPAFGTDGRIYIDTQAAAIYRDSGSAWVQVSGAGGGGTVTSVSSANADIGVSMASPTPVLTLNSGTGNNQIVKLNGTAQLPAVDGSLLTSLTPANFASVVPLNKGGTNANLTANNGGIVWSNGSQMQILNGTATAGLPLISGATATPAWSTINLSAGNIQMPAGGNISNAAGAMTVSATTNLTLAANTGSITTLGNSNTTSATQINGGGVGGGITLTPGTLGLGVTGWTSGFVKSNGSGVLAPAALASGDITTALTYTPVNKAGDTMSGNLTMQTNTGLVLNNTANTFAVTVKAPSALAANLNLVLPANNGSNTNVLQTDGAGNLSWVAAGSGSINALLTGYSAGAGTVSAADSILQAIQKVDGNDALKAPIASPTFTGTVTIPTSFKIGATTVTTTGAQLNYLNGATGTTGTTSTNLVYSTSPTLVTPTIGAATATSINKVAITQPATGSTLTIADGKSLTASNTLTFAGTDGSTLNIGAGGTLGSNAYTNTAYAPITTPTFTTNITTPMVIGGTVATQSLVYKTTTGVGAAGADHIFQVGNNGGTEAMRILNNGNVGIGTTGPTVSLDVGSKTDAIRIPNGTTAQAPAAANGMLRYDTTTGKLRAVQGGAWTDVIGSGGVSGSGTTSYIPKFSAAATLADSVMAESAGKIGIGTASPNRSLDILSATASLGLLRSGTLYGSSLQNVSDGSSYDRLDIGVSHNTGGFGPDSNVVMSVKSGGYVGIGTTSPNSSLHVAGPIATAIASKSTTYTVTATDSIVTASASGGAFTVTLPTAVGITGRQYTIKKTDNSANAVTVGTTSAQTIDGSTTSSLSSQYQYVTVVSDGANWSIVGTNSASGASGRTSCPGGFTLIGTSGSAEAFCISSSQETSATWLSATTTCYGKATKARLCSASEWAMACVAGASGPNNMTGHWEWVADLSGVATGEVVGLTGCGSFNADDVDHSYGSRCCFR